MDTNRYEISEHPDIESAIDELADTQAGEWLLQLAITCTGLRQLRNPMVATALLTGGSAHLEGVKVDPTWANEFLPLARKLAARVLRTGLGLRKGRPDDAQWS